jgi:hypothetical protein
MELAMKRRSEGLLPAEENEYLTLQGALGLNQPTADQTVVARRGAAQAADGPSAADIFSNSVKNWGNKQGQ